MKNMKEVGKFIRKKRKEKSYSLEDLAKMTGISYTYLGYIERGERPNIGREQIVKLCEALEIIPCLFFPEFIKTNDLELYRHEIQRLIDLNISPDDLNKMIDLVEYLMQKKSE